jgi:hypothetical protein
MIEIRACAADFSQLVAGENASNGRFRAETNDDGDRPNFSFPDPLRVLQPALVYLCHRRLRLADAQGGAPGATKPGV